MPYADSAAYVHAAACLAADHALRRHMASVARASVAGLGWNAIVARFEATLCRVIRETDRSAEEAFFGAGQPIG